MCELCDNVYALSQRQRVALSAQLNVEGLLQQVLNQLYNDRVVDKKTTDEYIQTHWLPLKQAVEEGWGKPLVKIEYGTPNYEFLKQLQYNAAVFSTFKSHSALKEMAARLKDENGNLLSKDAFKQEVWKVHGDYAGHKLDTEYDTAVRQARMAANWQRYVKNKRLYPNLKYTRSKASDPDKDHLQYVGIIAPVDSPFWNVHYPPNRWRCQCGAEPTDEAATDIPNDLPDVHPDFAFNSGKTGQVFDLEKSEYIKALPPAEQPRAIKKAKAMVDEQAIENLPYIPQYTSKSTGKQVTAHPLALNNNDFDAVKKNATILANAGHDVKILPDVASERLRKKLLPYDDLRPNKNPDVEIDGQWIADLKNTLANSANTVIHALDSARHQCDNAIIFIDKNSQQKKEDIIKKVIQKSKKPEMQNFNRIWLYMDGEFIKDPHKK